MTKAMIVLVALSTMRVSGEAGGTDGGGTDGGGEGGGGEGGGEGDGGGGSWTMPPNVVYQRNTSGKQPSGITLKGDEGWGTSKVRIRVPMRLTRCVVVHLSTPS